MACACALVASGRMGSCSATWPSGPAVWDIVPAALQGADNSGMQSWVPGAKHLCCTNPGALITSPCRFCRTLKSTHAQEHILAPSRCGPTVDRPGVQCSRINKAKRLRRSMEAGVAVSDSYRAPCDFTKPEIDTLDDRKRRSAPAVRFPGAGTGTPKVPAW